MSQSGRPLLRVGVFVSSLEPAAWVASLVDRIATSDFAELAVVVRAGTGEPDGHAVPGIYHRLDRRLFAMVEDASAPGRLPEGTPTVSLEDDGADETIGAAAPAVLLWLASTSPPPRLDGAPGCDVWWLDHGGEPPFLRELKAGASVVETRVLARAELPGDIRVLGSIVTSADSISLRRVSDSALWQAVELVLTCLRRRARGDLEANPSPGADDLRPIGRVAAAGIVTRVVGRAVGRRARSIVSDEQWVIAHRRRTPTDVVDGDMKGFAVLRPPAGRSYADPFLATHDGRRYVFFEDWPHGRPASISSVEVMSDGTLSEPQTELSRDYHLSYPFVFEAGGEWFMLPETSANRTIELYRAVEFPGRWALDRVLWDGVRAVDTTPFEHDGRTWIFTTIRTARGGATETMSIFSADSLTSPWHEHPANPVVADARSARPGGRVHARDGRLLRPAQDGSVRYGYALVLNEILALTPEAYREVAVRRIEPSWLPGATCTHHYDTDGELEVVDACVRVSRLRRG